MIFTHLLIMYIQVLACISLCIWVNMHITVLSYRVSTRTIQYLFTLAHEITTFGLTIPYDRTSKLKSKMDTGGHGRQISKMPIPFQWVCNGFLASIIPGWKNYSPLILRGFSSPPTVAEKNAFYRLQLKHMLAAGVLVHTFFTCF